MKNINRRDFLKRIAATAVGSSLITAGDPLSLFANNGAMESIPKRRLGKTNFMVTTVSIGGESIPIRGSKGNPELHQKSLDIFHRALDWGINYIDTSESYSGGYSETVIGEVMRSRRNEVFLVTKTRKVTQDGIEDDLFERSCERLQTDFVDMYHLHYVNSMEDLDARLNRENGAILAFERLKEKGRIGNIGITSHSTDILREAMKRYDFDCIFLTLNPAGIYMDKSPREARLFLREAAKTDVGIITMKIPARQWLFESGVTMEDSFRYALSAGRTGQSFPVHTANIGMSEMEQLEENVSLAKEFRPLSDAEMDRLEERAAAVIDPDKQYPYTEASQIPRDGS